MNTISYGETVLFLQTHQFNYQASQARLCFPIIKRIFHKMHAGVGFGNIKVSGSLIIDGHHRYIASLLLDIAPRADDWDRPFTGYKL